MMRATRRAVERCYTTALLLCAAAGSVAEVRGGIAESTSANCFHLLDSPLTTALWNEQEYQRLRDNYKANLNIDGKGAVLASPGAVPALKGCCPGGYQFHWMRDGALSMWSLQNTAASDEVPRTGVGL
jgi:GH15 family glucan-1,4-alpha-glucosidase